MEDKTASKSVHASNAETGVLNPIIRTIVRMTLGLCYVYETRRRSNFSRTACTRCSTSCAMSVRHSRQGLRAISSETPH